MQVMMTSDHTTQSWLAALEYQCNSHRTELKISSVQDAKKVNCNSTIYFLKIYKLKLNISGFERDVMEIMIC